MILLALQLIAAGQTFDCTPVQVVSGDSFDCAEGALVRLAGVAARNMDGSCRPEHPCPRASAGQARDLLALLIGRDIGRSAQGHVLVNGETLFCRSTQDVAGDRTEAWCSNQSGDLSCLTSANNFIVRWGPQWRWKVCG